MAQNAQMKELWFTPETYEKITNTDGGNILEWKQHVEEIRANPRVSREQIEKDIADAPC